jgi:hypothetical protein
MNSTLFWHPTPCSLRDVIKYSISIYIFRKQDRKFSAVSQTKFAFLTPNSYFLVNNMTPLHRNFGLGGGGGYQRSVSCWFDSQSNDALKEAMREAKLVP